MQVVPVAFTDRALEVARVGLPIFPLWWPRNGGCACRAGLECRQPGKHPRILGWQTEATTDEAKIREWWAKWPTANIGIATGTFKDLALPGTMVLDVDAPAGGVESLAALEAAHGLLPESVEVLTGRANLDGVRGRHIYFRHPGLPLGNSVKKLGPGLDVRCDGGLVVGPGSIHASGLTYEWEIAHHPDNTPFAEVPRWLLDRIVLQTRPAPTLEAVSWMEPEGLPPIPDRIERALRWLAERDPAVQGQGGSAHTMGICAVVTRGFALERDEDALEALADWNDRCVPPWDVNPDARAANSLLRKIQEGRSKGAILVIGEKLRAPRRAYLGSQLVALARGNPGGDSAAQPDLGTAEDDEPVIQVLAVTGAAGELSNLVKVSELALRRQPIYAFGGNLVTLRLDEGGPTLMPVAKDQLRVLLNRVVGFAKPRGKEFQECWPPDEVLGALLTQGSWELPRITAVVEAPTLRPDGTVLNTPGYDPLSGIFFVSDSKVSWEPVSDSPTQEEVTVAFSCLSEPLRDFPFHSEHHWAAAIAAIITAVIRPAISGPVPMFLFDATAPGTGKGLLANLVATIATGRRVPIIPAISDEDEMRKLITTLAMEGARMIVIDNVTKPLGGAALDAALTSTRWRERMLGTNRTFDGPLRPFWGATGNNIQIRGDMLRRVVPIRMATMVADPESRQDFVHGDLLAYVGENRAKLVSAALTMLRAYIAAGRPRPADLPRAGGFEEWDDLVRAVLVWVGCSDILEGRREMRDQADNDTAAIQQLLGTWHRVLGSDPWTLRALKRHLDGAPPGEASTIKDALIELAGTNDGKDWQVSRAGYLLRRYQGRVFDGLRIVVDSKGEHGVRWRVEGL